MSREDEDLVFQVLLQEAPAVLSTFIRPTESLLDRVSKTKLSLFVMSGLLSLCKLGL